MSINFAHRTFTWESEAKGKAHVHVVIIGFSGTDKTKKFIVDYPDGLDTPILAEASSINGYLIDGPHRYLSNRTKPLSSCPIIRSGCKPVDGGNYLFTSEERDEFLSSEPESAPYFRRWLGSREFINRIERWCLWVGEADPSELKKLPMVMSRIENVRELRLKSKKAKTRELANLPTRFEVETLPDKPYLLIPKVSSSRRRYIPVGFVHPPAICSDLCVMVANADLYNFGVVTSEMHMAWVRTVCGRLKSDYRYSAKLVYNNYPWPQDVTNKQREAVETAAQAVLDVREEFPDASLADLYDPLSMPASLTKAHAKLDRAVDRCYRSQPFPHERNRVEFLFERYERLSAPLVAMKKTKRQSKK